MPKRTDRLATMLRAAILPLALLGTAPAAHAQSAPSPLAGALRVASVLAVLALGGLAFLLWQRLQRSEASRRQTEAELTHARAWLAIQFELNPVPMSITRIEDGSYLEVNGAWERLSGWKRSEVLGMSSTALGGWITAEERAAWIAGLGHCGTLLNHPTRFRNRAGEIRHFLSSAQIIDYEGEAGIFAAFIDITEQRRAETELLDLNLRLEERVAERTRQSERASESLKSSLGELQRTRDELVHLEKMASLGSMVAGISHELNTPLGNSLTVSTTLQALLQELRRASIAGPLSRQEFETLLDDMSEGSAMLTRNLERATELVKSFKQVSIDQSSERRRRFALDEQINDVLNALRPMLRPTPIELKVLLDKDIWMDSYPGPLGQVIVSLVKNAAQHGLADRPRGLIRVEALACGEARVELRIADDGAGIAEADLPRIFDPFFTTRPGSGNAGLGLSISHRIVTRVLGGSIRVDASPGAGTSVRIMLPRVAPNDPQPTDSAP